MRSGTLENGLRYAVRRSGRSVAYCALTIGCGTRDEAGYPGGIAHFVEHTMFRGTRRKSAGVISSYLDRLGGELIGSLSCHAFGHRTVRQGFNKHEDKSG